MPQRCRRGAAGGTQRTADVPREGRRGPQTCRGLPQSAAEGRRHVVGVPQRCREGDTKQQQRRRETSVTNTAIITAGR